MAVIRQHKIVWGGHPAITPMIWSICEDLGVDYSGAVVLYQSTFFKDRYPEENDRFHNVVFTNAVAGDREASLLLMREEMLSRDDLVAAVFIGGMEGVEAEHEEPVINFVCEAYHDPQEHVCQARRSSRPICRPSPLS